MEANEPKPPSIPRLSKAPSWVSVGFVLGALFVWLLREPAPETPPVVAVKRELPPPDSPPAQSLTALPDQPSLPAVEAVFAQWEHKAVWLADRTQISMWNTAGRKYSDCFEVIRRGDDYFFRSLPRLDWPMESRDVESRQPILFAIPPDARR